MEELTGERERLSTISEIAPLSYEQAISAAQNQVAALYNDLDDALAQGVKAFAEQEPDLNDTVAQMDELIERIRAAYNARYQGISTLAFDSENDVSRRLGKTLSLESWRSQLEERLRYLLNTPRPLLRKNRANDIWTFDPPLSGLLGAQDWIVHKLIESARLTFGEKGRKAAQDYLAERSEELRARADQIQAAIPEVTASLSAESLRTHRDPTMAGPKVIIGHLEPGLTLSVRGGYHGEPDEATLRRKVETQDAQSAALGINTRDWLSLSELRHRRETTSQLPPIAMPVALPLLFNLDRDGGLVTDSLATINNLVLRLLAILPAGRLTASLFDPRRLGDSGSVLFGLGESAHAIIGDKVRTSERELLELLADLENHITFVTQKYLQGAFDSLTDYNRAAGEITEPYRLLVLYDYPAGFARPGGKLDDEALGRLTKIVSAGPRCGVFTLVVSAKGQPKSDGPLAKLPWLWTSGPIEPHRLAQLIGGMTQRWSHSGGETFGRKQTRQYRTCFVWSANAGFRFRPEPELPRDVTDAILGRIQRGLARADDVRVTPRRVAELAKARLAKGVALGIQAPETLPDLASQTTWWHGTTTDEVSAAFGRVGADDVGILRFDTGTFSGALVGGQPGAGKSVLLHAIIASLTTRYSPTELELYLVDFKKGVEFKVYAAEGLPHARTVAIESDREFGLSVLEALDAEITRRGALFREGSGAVVDISTYRRKSGLPLSRILLIVDEFHILFERDDKLATRGAELLDRIVREGRAFGVHTILCSQTLAGMVALGKHTLNQIPIRIALQCSETDSRLLLADDNPDARLLTHKGEGILNTAKGLRDANLRFQASFTSPDERASLVAELRRLADNRSFTRRPVVFEARVPVSVAEVPAATFCEQPSPTVLRLPLGLPLTLAGPVAAELRREPGGNLLVVTPDDQAYPCLSVMLATLAACAVETAVCDYSGLDTPWAPLLERLEDTSVTVVRRREAGETLRRMDAAIAERHTLREYRSRPQVLVLGGVHRARELDAGAGGEETEMLERILRDGPEVGIHVICWCDRPVSLQRRLSSSAQRELAVRLVGQMSREDSFQLIDAELAAYLDPSQMVLDDHDRATTTRLRRFDMPAPDWVERIVRGGADE